MKNILLIEDDRLAAELEQLILSQSGLSVRWVTTIDDAKRAIAESPPDLILSDLQLEEGTAEGTVEYLATLTDSFPVVACSGHFDTELGLALRAACVRAGVVDYLDKFNLRMSSPAFADNLATAYNLFHASCDSREKNASVP